MTQSKAWDWDKTENPIWRIPSEESHFLAQRWRGLGYKAILDLGCGLGRHAIFFAKHGFQVSAMDLSPEGVKSTSQWARKEGLPVDVREGDMLSLPYDEASFDCLFAYHVISHTDTKGAKKIISEIRRVVKPGGEIYVTLCSKETWSFKEAGFPVIDENTVRKTDGPEDGVPHFYVNLDGLLELFGGFEIISVRHVDDCYFDGQKRNSRHYFLLARRDTT